MERYKIHFALYGLCSVAFMASLAIHPYPGSWFLKAIPAWTLAFILISSKNTTLKIMGIGYVFSSAGDIFLDLDRKAFFIHGLVSFLLGHTLYTAAFSRNLAFQKSRLPLAVFMLVWCGIIGILLFPNLGRMTIPVNVYLLVILSMGLTASMQKSDFPLAGIGALIFMISDSIIAINKFLTPLCWAGPVIMLTYYGGHFLMGFGFLRSLGKNSQSQETNTAIKGAC